MTTIAGNSEFLCTDSMCADGNQKWSVVKVERIGGSLFGTAGTAAHGEAFYEWMRRNKRGKKPLVGEDFEALALTPKGLFLYDSNLYPLPLLNPHAVGSGAQAARSAMLVGADIVAAVTAACEVDAHSGLPIQIYRLKETQS